MPKLRVLGRFNFTQIRAGEFNLMFTPATGVVIMIVATGLSHDEAKEAMDQLNDVLRDCEEGVICNANGSV